MKKIASGIIEVALLMCFVAVVSVVVLTVFNAQKKELAEQIHVTKRVSE